MTVLTNLWLAFPTFAIVAIVILGMIHQAVGTRFRMSGEANSEGHIKFNRLMGRLVLAVIVLGLISAITSPIFLPKNVVDATDSSIVESRKLNEVEEAEASAGTPVDRMPKPKQRDNFVHDMKRKESE